MSNTVTTTVLSRSPRKIVLYVTILSDGSEETATVLYDSSAQASAIGIVDSLSCTLNKVWYSVSSTTALIHLLFDANTDVLACPVPFDHAGYLDFSSAGGLKNYASTGKTGDITITTTNMNAGESVTLVLEVLPY